MVHGEMGVAHGGEGLIDYDRALSYRLDSTSIIKGLAQGFLTLLTFALWGQAYKRTTQQWQGYKHGIFNTWYQNIGIVGRLPNRNGIVNTQKSGCCRTFLAFLVGWRIQGLRCSCQCLSSAEEQILWPLPLAGIGDLCPDVHTVWHIQIWRKPKINAN